MEYLGYVGQRLNDESERAMNALDFWKVASTFAQIMIWPCALTPFYLGRDLRLIYVMAACLLINVVCVVMRNRARRIAENRMSEWTDFLNNHNEFCVNR